MGADLQLRGLPAAAWAVGRQWATAAHTALGLPEPTDDEVEQSLTLPLGIEPDWPGPSAPRRVGPPGSVGWVQADVNDDDLDAFDALRGAFPDADAESLARHGQEWRLPVLPYRRHRPPQSWRPVLAPIGSPWLARPGLRVVDLSALWAGPACARLLARAGASVTKVDPDCRPDGFRERPALYRALNEGKDIVDLDLRVDTDRARFERLVAGADVLISSFSRRVLPNLGYDVGALRSINPRLRSAHIVGFGEGVERGWLTYGSGIHAICGLGWSDAQDDGPPQPTPVAYPDPLTAYLTVLALAAAGPGDAVEVPLAAAGAEVAHR